MRVTAFALAFATLVALPSHGFADAIEDCNSDKPDAVISGCTTLIDAGKTSKDALTVAYFNRGNAYDDKGDHDAAIADYTAALKIKNDFSDAYLNRGFAYESKGDFDSAIADYTRVIALAPDYAKAYYSRGRAYEGKGELKQALASYQDAIRLAPGNGTVLKKIAEVNRKLGE